MIETTVQTIVEKIMQEQAAESPTISDLLDSGTRQAENVLDLAAALQITHRDVLLALAARIGGQLGREITEAQARDSERNAP